MLDDPAVIEKKFKRAVTDTDGEVRFDPEAKPGVSNLLSILGAATGRRPRGAWPRATRSTGRSRPTPPRPSIELLRPIQARYAELAADPRAPTHALLAQGADQGAGSTAADVVGSGPRRPSGSCRLD